MDQGILNQLGNLVNDLSIIVEELRKPRELSRAEIAAMAMQGMVANPRMHEHNEKALRGGSGAAFEPIQKTAVAMADALIAELAKERKP